MLRRLIQRFVAVCALVTFGAAAQAGVVPPPWASTDFTNPKTEQLWTFDNGPITAPSFFNNPNGAPTFNPDGSFYEPVNPFGPAGGGGWLVGDGTFLDLVIPNYNQLFRKEIWITIKFSLPPAGAGVPLVDILGQDGSIGTPFGPTFTPSPVDGQPGVLQQAYLYQMPTCWTFRLRVTVPTGIPGSAAFISQIYVATRCIIPAPASAAIMGLASLINARRRRGA
jgi:hypothetical protein